MKWPFRGLLALVLDEIARSHTQERAAHKGGQHARHRPGDLHEDIQVRPQPGWELL